ncbi:CoA transferase (plasmid) [Phyllobacterium sp. 628]|uniref:CaiB/BaiF CoA transferase family protein n=1 Tax=Phyllobacterium sp. 628 TaxID=2718938 RepID=UPI001662770F|nr:CaiB/BaiF CoA-transferase family protein [Phyllobacterium sp. 628]QND55055.1 CoA transferase [Phyllobacterium sp. 628]
MTDALIQHPLHNLRVVEFEGIGPGPLAGRMLADLGAHVTVIARPGSQQVMREFGDTDDNPLRRNKTVITLDLKSQEGVDKALALIANADALIEANRPGVMERLGLGPAHCAERNPRLVYGRMTGWGQTGPLAQTAGHDLNYLALTGMLSLAARTGEAPVVPPTIMGDAAGALGLCFGLISAVFDARSSGIGRVVDAAIVDVVAMLGAIVQLARATGQIDGPVPSPFHDSPFYDTYACADGRFITIGALETQFYALLLSKLGFHDVDPASQYDRTQWPALKARFEALFASQPQNYWSALLEGTDVCFAPVLSIAEAVDHPHNRDRAIYQHTASGLIEASAAPRFSALVPDK